MKINIFRNPFMDAQVGYLLDSMVDARRKETEAYWREVLKKEMSEEYDRGYQDGCTFAADLFVEYFKGFPSLAKVHVNWLDNAIRSGGRDDI